MYPAHPTFGDRCAPWALRPQLSLKDVVAHGTTRPGVRLTVEYRTVRIKDVISGINRDYFLPAIQREFVWEPEQIEKLFDSILGDYPIGSFLFWKVEERNKEQWTTFEFIRQFDKAKPHNPEADLKGITRDILLVLDGQQRMSSLFI